MTQRTPFDTMPDGTPVEAITIGADGIAATILTLGATLQRLEVAGRNVVLGHGSVAEYLDSVFYMGASCGRFANRIGGGRFTLDGTPYQLLTNEHGNTLHGGRIGFDKRVWEVTEVAPQAVEFRLVSDAGDQGFPGTLEARARFEVRPGLLEVVYRATTDAATPVNLTTHAYFNLDGSGATDAHTLDLASHAFVAVDDQLIPTGRLADLVELIPAADTGVPTIAEAAPLDHCFVIDGDGMRRHVTFATSDLAVEIWSDQPGLQVYSGDALHAGERDQEGRGYGPRSGIALETQQFPDAVNHPNFPDTILRPGQEYVAVTQWRFRTPGEPG